ncbi:nucleoside permease [Enterobacter cloacae]|uniref:nucleoside permease n=1 Tax=Enterobacter cloacae TaxID=550 RepID=UPI0029C07788|nr:nucleoside permease [Enterobacter cloacae]
MKTKVQLSFMMFVEWFIWGAWFVPLWLWLSKSGFTAGEIGWSYACTAIAAILSPILVGSLTDRFFAAQKVLAVLMFAGAILMYFAAQQTQFSTFFPLLLAYSLTYMPTIALTNSIAFANVDDVEADFPLIRVMGTIGWIASGLACGFLPQMLGYSDISDTNIPLLMTAASSALLGVFALFLPNTPPKSTGKLDFKVMLGLDALILLRDKNFLVFFFCSFLFAMPLAFYYIFANGYLTEVGMKNATGWMTLGQFSEIFFMLALPFFTKRFGIKKVLLLGLLTAAIRYGFFVYGGAEQYFTYALLFLGILLYGVSYDFYYVTAYIYVDKKAPAHMRTAAQGLITLCCQGFGSLLGYRLGGVMMEKMFAYKEPVNGLTFNWAGMWTFGAIMIAVIAVLFMLFFRESDKDITAIEVVDGDAALTQGEVK